MSSGGRLLNASDMRVIDPSMTDADFGRDFLGGKSAKTARRVITEEGIPHMEIRGHWLVKQSDAEIWREANTVQIRNDLKSIVAAAVRRARERRAL